MKECSIIFSNSTAFYQLIEHTGLGAGEANDLVILEG